MKRSYGLALVFAILAALVVDARAACIGALQTAADKMFLQCFEQWPLVQASMMSSIHISPTSALLIPKKLARITGILRRRPIPQRSKLRERM